jgi:uncharacterized membrane protein
VLALVYIDRLIQRDNFVLVSLNVHRVVITSLMVAAKFFDDFYFNNAFYARVGGIGTVEVMMCVCVFTSVCAYIFKCVCVCVSGFVK